MSRFTSRIVGIALVMLAAWFYADTRPLYQPDGVLVERAPVETRVASEAPTFDRQGWRLTAVARYAGEGRVLSVKRYGSNRDGDLAPVDVALGWGRLSDSAVLRNVDVAQGERRLFFQSHDTTVDDARAAQSIVNLHVVPASPAVEERVRELRAGNLVRIEGYAVRAAGPEQRQWEGEPLRPGEAAASRLLWVETLEIRPPAQPPTR